MGRQREGQEWQGVEGDVEEEVEEEVGTVEEGVGVESKDIELVALEPQKADFELEGQEHSQNFLQRD